MLSETDIFRKLNGYLRGEVPVGCTKLTLAIDVQQDILFWLLAGWEQNFTGYIIDYGTWPDQGRQFFTLNDLPRPISSQTNTVGLEAITYYGLGKLCDELMPRTFFKDGSIEIKISQCVIDANWGQVTDVVYQFCRQSIYSSRLLPAHGIGVGASSMPFSDYKKKPGGLYRTSLENAESDPPQMADPVPVDRYELLENVYRASVAGRYGKSRLSFNFWT